MSTIGPVEYQDAPNGDTVAMDTTPVLQAHSDGVSPSFLPTLTSHPPLQNQLMQEASPVFSNLVDPPSVMAVSMHPPASDIPPTVFMNPMEANAPVRAAPPSFLSLPMCGPFTMTSSMETTMSMEMSSNGPPLSGSPPQSQVPSPSIHGSASSYSIGVTSSLESALDQPGVPMPRSRANTSVSPSTIPSSFISMSPANHVAMGMAFTSAETAAGKLEDTSSGTEPNSILVDMLADIAQTASSARDMCVMQPYNVEAGFKFDHLKERIAQVSQMFAGMMSVSSPEAQFSPPSYTTPQIPTSEVQHPLNFPPSAITPPTSAMDVSELLSVSDHSRKRCASELEEHRTVKAPKREPQDDTPLSLPLTEPPSNLDTSPNFQSSTTVLPLASTHSLTHPPSQPSSRPPTPPGSFSSHGLFTPVKQPPANSVYASFLSTPAVSLEFDPNSSTSISPAPPTFPSIHTSWSDPIVPSRHHHSLSAGSIHPLTASAVTNMVEGFPTPMPNPLPLQSLPPMHPNATATISPPIGRMSRSGSISGAFPNSYSFGYIDPYSEAKTPWSGGINRVSGKAPTWFVGGEGMVPSISSSVASDIGTAVSTARNTPTDDDDDDDDEADSDDGDGGLSKNNHTSGDSPAGSSTGSDVPQEYRAEVDRIFFEYLNKVCSNLDATDSKGEPIHQTLMAKKMQRLDESPDFRPFKFRIQAFTLAFLDELANQGYPEEKIPMKKIRNYLWRQQYILRFNEDGKKAKSKGNHIWNIEAKKAGDNKWEFRPFHRKIAGSPPAVAYCGLKWSWTPRIWDPQASWSNIPVEYSSPSLPSWLSWKDDVLSGTPSRDAESCRITTNAKFALDGQEGHLSHTFHLTIAPMNNTETTSLSRSRRPSLAGDPPRRSTSDSVLFQAVQRSKSRPSPAAVTTEPPDTRVIRVLQSVALRVTEEAASQYVSASPPKTSNLQDLVKQKHVLEQTVDAYDKALSGRSPIQSRRLAVAAQNVVVQAARAVIADRTVANGGVVVQQSESSVVASVTVNELSDATQDAIAEAVKRGGIASTDVDIIVAATSILKSRTPGSPSAMGDAISAPAQQIRSHSTGTVPRMTPSINNAYPTNLPSLSEYV